MLCMAVALVACNGDALSETDTMDTVPLEETTLDGVSEIPEIEAPADTEPHETVLDSNTPSEVSTEEVASPEETEFETDSVPAGPGKLIHIANDGLCFLNNMGKEIGVAFEEGQYDNWKNRTITIGIGQVAVFMDRGWIAFDSRDYEFGYVVNGADYFSDSYAEEAEASVVEMARKLGANHCSRFIGGLTTEVLMLGENKVQFCVRLDGGETHVLREYTVNLTRDPVRLDGSYWNIPIDSWTVSGHNPHIQDTSNGMVAAGGVEKGALLHQGAIGVGTVDLSKYDKVIIMWGCDSSPTTVDRYNANPHNRIMLTKVDTDGMMSPESKDIIAYADYTLSGWRVQAIEIDLSKVSYKGPVYITIDALPGTFTLFSSIEFTVE